MQRFPSAFSFSHFETKNSHKQRTRLVLFSNFIQDILEDYSKYDISVAVNVLNDHIRSSTFCASATTIQM